MNKEKFEAYEAVRESGVTNMFNVKLVGQLSGLSKEECFDIMDNYDVYKIRFGNVKAELSTKKIVPFKGKRAQVHLN